MVVNPERRLAVLDIGTNSAHLLIAEVSTTGRFNLLDKHKIFLRLGNDLDLKSKILSEAGCDKIISAVRQMQNMAKQYDADLKVVATHALRSSKNRDAVLNKVWLETGVSIELIDGTEEARLIAIGARTAVSSFNERLLIVDIGGGSTEIAVNFGEDIEFTSSLQIGSVLMTRMFFSEPKLKKRHVESAAQHIRNRLAPIAQELRSIKFDSAVICSGTGKALAAVDAAEQGQEIKTADGYLISRRRFEAVAQKIKTMRSSAKIMEAWPIESHRADILLAGTMILQELSSVFNIKAWTVSGFALREGVLFDSLLKRSSMTEKQEFANSVRWQSVLALAGHFNVEERQAKNVMHLSLRLFDELKKFNNAFGVAEHLTDNHREILQAAAWLHETGKYINFPRYHKHSIYIIKNSQLLGFSIGEKRLIGLIARFHRKGIAHEGSTDCAGVSLNELAAVNVLSSLLRIAVSACRSRRDLVQDLVLSRVNGVVALTVYATSAREAQVEFQQVENEKSALESILGETINIELEELG